MRAPCQTVFLMFSRWFYMATPGGRHGGTWRPLALRRSMSRLRQRRLDPFGQNEALFLHPPCSNPYVRAVRLTPEARAALRSSIEVWGQDTRGSGKCNACCLGLDHCNPSQSPGLTHGFELLVAFGPNGFSRPSSTSFGVTYPNALCRRTALALVWKSTLGAFVQHLRVLAVDCTWRSTLRARSKQRSIGA